MRELSGILSSDVQLVTNHATIDPLTSQATDALANTQLVLVPPPGEAHPHPTALFQTTPERSKAVTYPPVPEAVRVTGTITGPGGASVAADLVFEGMSVPGAAG